MGGRLAQAAGAMAGLSVGGSFGFFESPQRPIVFGGLKSKHIQGAHNARPANVIARNARKVERQRRKAVTSAKRVRRLRRKLDWYFDDAKAVRS